MSTASMPPPSPPPHLTPQFCFSETALRSFLATSRAFLDDTITQNLNALLTPSRAGFDATSTSLRRPATTSRAIDARTCRAFRERVLFPAWQARDDVLDYCAGVAGGSGLDGGLGGGKGRGMEREVVDERMDPYSGRVGREEEEEEGGRRGRLRGLVRNERGVEGIVRARTWGVVRGRCGDDGADEDGVGGEGGWEAAVGRWRAGRREG